MPGKRITDLTALSGANSANNDDLVIFDATASETKRISRSQLAEGMQADVQVLSNKTLALGSNTVTGTTAQFNTALTDGDFATLAGAETLTNKTISGGTINGTVTASGDLTIADKIVHDGDTNTAIRFPAADTVTVETAGTERLRVNSSGNVGIGTTSPDALLTVNGVSSFGDGSAAAPSITNTGDLNTGIFFPAADVIAFSEGGVERLRIADAGQIGIGGANYGTSGQVLTSGGASAAPSWATAVGLTADVQEFTSSGTWTMPANAKLVYVEIWGGGGGGGSGRRNSNTGSPPGGGGGGGAAGVFYQFRASELTSTVSVTIGAGGNGGAAVTTNDTAGNSGSAGGDSTFASFLTGKGGLGGSATGGGGSGWTEAFEVNDATENQNPYGGGAPSSYNIFGGGGGGTSASNVNNSGSDVLKPGTGAAGGGAGGTFVNTILSNSGVGGVRWGSRTTSVNNTGVALGVAGAAGSGFGNAGGGGGHGRTASAGSGGAGATAAGGGGGGASGNGFTSGAGGAGGNGFCRVTTYS